jgi:UDP-3-O-[3-hydroxymyristoyl] glucosamine N-acyltransferase
MGPGRRGLIIVRAVPGASISPLAAFAGTAADGATVGPFAVVATGARLGSDCVVHPHVVVGEGAVIGDRTVLHPHVVIGAGVVLGADVEVLPSAVIGREPKGAGATARAIAFVRRLTVADGCCIGAHATLYYDVEVGAGTLIGDGASIREGGRIGRRCIVSRCVTFNYDVVIGDDVKIMDSTHITGGTRIGDRAFISTMVASANDNDPSAALGETQRLTGPRIEQDAVIGAGAVLLPGIVVGRGATVAAGAVVTADVAPRTLVLGTPARVRVVKPDQVSEPDP